jgi:VanZ family protein
MLLWLVVISLESTSIFTSGHTAGWLMRLLSLFGHPTYKEINLVNEVLRKVGHFTGYALLSWFAFRGWMETLAYRTEERLRRLGKTVYRQRYWHFRAALLAVLCTFVVAGLDEYHQAFIPGRTGVFHDVVLDTFGGIFAQLLLLLYWTKRGDGPTLQEPTSQLKEISAD